jgi:hypothetical protein
VNKVKRKQPMGLLHPLPEHITIDFFFNLPTVEDRYNRVWLVVDCFSKMVKLIPITKTLIVEKTTRLYMKHVYCNYRLSKTIILDQDMHFNSDFWQVLWKLTGTTLYMAAPRHQQTDGQSE